MALKRSAGTLVHPTSFPSNYGIGDLGSTARNFIDFLEDTDQTIWQILPLGPVGYGNSPYMGYSAFAGNHYLISPDILAEKGLLTPRETSESVLPHLTEVEYSKAFEIKDRLFASASKRFFEQSDADTLSQFEKFKKDNSYWLPDYALFMACREYFSDKLWNLWDEEIAKRGKKAIERYNDLLADQVNYHYWLQFEFFDEWKKLHEYAASRDIAIVGDIPIFVNHNSADVWAHPDLFEIDEDGNRVLVSGVPPDYFSETGQLWGNPLYRWDKIEKQGFKWWLKRFEQMFDMFDLIRVDHFRGFEAYWAVEASEKTAVNGKWIKGPGAKLFNAIKKKLGELPIIAEDLGVMTEEVEKLRDQFEFPGMKVLQFAFLDDEKNNFLPHNYENSNCIVYTGTHDNDTTLGWYHNGTEREKHRVREYTRSDGSQINWELIRLAMLSVAEKAIIPLQDYMNLGTEHRMNYPGTSTGNWKWRYTTEMLARINKENIRNFIRLSNRGRKKDA